MMVDSAVKRLLVWQVKLSDTRAEQGSSLRLAMETEDERIKRVCGEEAAMEEERLAKRSW